MADAGVRIHAMLKIILDNRSQDHLWNRSRKALGIQIPCDVQLVTEPRFCALGTAAHG